MLSNVLQQLKKGGESRTNEKETGSSSDRQEEATTDRVESEHSRPSDESVATPGDEGPAIDLNQVFGLLRNRRRRDVFWYLLGTDEQVRLGDLAEAIAARECEKPVSQITSQERKRVYIGLYQGHLPKMDDCGAITYNQQRGTIDRGPNFEAFIDYLPDDEDALGADDADHGPLRTVLNLLT